jgi:hypothetical protein
MALCGFQLGGFNLGAGSGLPNRARKRLWTPAEITTELWLDADDASTITLNDGNVSQWDDKSGNNQHATQENATKQPTIQTINGVNALRFDGTDDSMVMPKPPFVFGSVSIFSVWDVLTANSNYVYGSNNSAGETRIYHSRSSAITGRFDANQSDSIPYLGVNGNARVALQESTNLESPYNSYLYRDGTLQGSRLGSELIGEDIIDMRLGCRAITGSESVFANATIGEMIVINNGGSQLSTDTRQKVEGYLAHKWGLSANLPADHPYKSSPPLA